MNDIIIFGMGCFVSLVVAAAVGLLLWGAAHEPSGNVLPNKGSERAAPQPRTTSPSPTPAGVLQAKSPA